MPVIPESYDRTEALSFLGALVEDIDTPLSWRVFHDQVRGRSASNIFGSFNDVAPRLVAAQQSGHGVFVIVNTTRPNGTDDASVTSPRALFIDGDGIPMPTAWVIQPTILVQRTAIRWHAYWLLEEGEDIRRFRDAQRHLADWYGGDTQIINESRVMRVPGFFHLKDPNHPEMYRVVRHSPSALYTIDQVIAAHVVDATKQAEIDARKSEAEKRRRDERGASAESALPMTSVEGPIPEGGRNAQLASMAGHLRRCGLSTDAIAAALQQVNRERCRPPLDAREVSTIARSIARYDFDPVVAAEANGVEIPAPSGIVPRFYADRTRERTAPPPAIIPGLLPVGGIGAVIALPGVGKTLVSIELARCVASGGSFGGVPVMRGTVLYVCPDAPASTERRTLGLTAAENERIVTVVDLPRRLPADVAALRQLVVDLNARPVAEPVRLIVLDTWDASRSHASGGYADQDAAAEVLMAELRRLASDLGLAVVIVHHGTKADGGKARGSIVFDARCDWIASVDAAGASVLLTSTKCRDGERGKVGAWQIEARPVGDSTVPVLVSQSDARAQEMASDLRDLSILRTIIDTADAGEPLTIRGLAETCRLGRGSQTSRPIARLREAGLIAADSLLPTAEGRAAADKDNTTYVMHPQRVQKGAGATAGASDAPGCTGAGADDVSHCQDTMHPGADEKVRSLSAPTTPFYKKGGAGAGDVSQKQSRSSRVASKPTAAEDFFDLPAQPPKRKGTL